MGLVLALLLSQALYPQTQLANCAYSDPRGCTLPALALLWGGPSPSQICSGSLTANTGQAVTNTRASNAYCYNGTNLVLLSNNQPPVEAAMGNLGNGLRVESGATNTVLQSNTFSNASWTADGTSVAQNVTGPDGVANSAWTLTNTTLNVQHRIYQGGLFSSATYAWSIYGKAGTACCISLNYNNTPATLASFNFSTGLPFNVGGSVTATMTPLSNGWYRATMVVPATAIAFAIVAMCEVPGATCNQSATYAGTPASLFIYGMQIEQQALASSFIPTTTVAVLRAADQDSVSSPLSGANFAVASTFTPNAPAWADASLWLLLSSGTFGAANSWYGSVSNSGVFSLNTYDNADANRQTSGNPTISAAQHRIAFSTSSGVTATYLDGSAVAATATGVGTNALASQPGTILIGELSNGNQTNGWLTQICADSSISRCTP